MAGRARVRDVGGGAGCAAAYVTRSNVPFVVRSQPEAVGPDLAAVADAILLVDEPAR